MFTEDELLPISGLQHFAFCPRQCALIHIENVWADNFLSAEGSLFHERVHNGPDERNHEKIVLRSLRITSFKYGICGFADVVEFIPSADGIQLPGSEVCWLPVPVEYKRGKPKRGIEDKVQISAQMLCLEEYWNINIPVGYLFYGKTRHREKIIFDQDLRSETVKNINKYRELIYSRKLPPAYFHKKCQSCSLIETCQPKSPKSALNYISKMLMENS